MESPPGTWTLSPGRRGRIHSNVLPRSRTLRPGRPRAWGWLLAAVLLLLPQPSAGTPLSKPEILKLVQKKVHERRLLAVVRELGMDFKLTPEVMDELRAAGARPSLIQGLRSLSAETETAALPPSPSSPPAPVLESPSQAPPLAETPAPAAPDAPPPQAPPEALGSPPADTPPAGAMPPPVEPPPPEPPSRWETVKPLLEEALALAKDAEFRRAQALLVKAMEIDPAEPAVWKAFKEIEQDLLLRAETFLADGQLPRALREFQFVIRTNPESARGHNGVGLVLLDMKSYDEAVSAFERATALDPANARYRQALHEARRLQKASRALEERGKENLKEMLEAPGKRKGP